MKIAVLFFASAGLASLGLASLDPSGSWKLGYFEQSFFTTSDPVSVNWSSSDIGTDDVTVDPDRTYMSPDETGLWLFSDDLLNVVSTDNQLIPITENLDTISFADTELITDSDGVLEEVIFEIGIRLPDSDFTSSEVEGTWNILRQTDVTFQSKITDDSGYTVTYHARDQLVLNNDGSFTLTEVQTTDPDGTDDPINGTWAVNNRTIELSVGQESLPLENISSGLDTFNNFRIETFDNVTFTNFDRSIEVALKEPTSLAAGDIVGTWGLTELVTDVDTTNLNSSFLFSDLYYAMSYVEFKANGTGSLTVFESSNPSEFSDGSFTWSIVGKKIRITDSTNDVLEFFVSAEKDFAAGLSIDQGSGGTNEFFSFFTLCKLPDAPGFGAILPSLTLGATPTLGIETENGLFYQLQRTTDLIVWTDVGSPIAGDGTTKTAQDLAAPNDKAFYRWAVVNP